MMRRRMAGVRWIGSWIDIAGWFLLLRYRRPRSNAGPPSFGSLFTDLLILADIDDLATESYGESASKMRLRKTVAVSIMVRGLFESARLVMVMMCAPGEMACEEATSTMKRNAIVGLLLAALLGSIAACVPTAPTAPTAMPPSATQSGSETTAVPTVVEAVPPTDEPQVTPTPEPPMAARANGQPVLLADYERALAQYEADLAARGIDSTSDEGQAEMDRAKAWILNVMIEQVLTEQAAAEAGIAVSDADVDAYMQSLTDENGGQDAFLVKLAERGETYESAREEVRRGLLGMAMTQRISEQVPTTAEQVHARHILVDTQEEAERILNQLQASADFASLAKAYSQDTSTKDSGGDLGFFPRGILVAPEVEQVAFALQPGQFSGVISSTLGYHIVQVVERDPQREVSSDNLLLLQDQAVQQWIESMWATAVVERYVDAGP